jgi:hypothetical protein
LHCDDGVVGGLFESRLGSALYGSLMTRHFRLYQDRITIHRSETDKDSKRPESTIWLRHVAEVGAG